MTFISYAQNFEDVMLWRALKHVKDGFYIDIGAQDPIVDSVSLAFYERGWRGVHVEPSQQYSEKLRIARPDETVIQLAVGNKTGPLTFYEFEGTGLSTADVEIAEKHRNAGYQCAEIVVPVISLDALYERIGSQEIHWLKLDVEGFEKSVLESWHDCSFLPWILVVESTKPLTQEESYLEWEPYVLSKGYRYIYFDGLNRYYVSPAHSELGSAFKSPPNIFDGFLLSGSASQPFCKLAAYKAQEAETKAQEAETKAQEAETKAQEAETKAQEAETKAQEASQFMAQLQAVYASKSWRLTAPLRQFMNQWNLLRQYGLRLRMKALVKKVLLKLLCFVRARPALVPFATRLASRLGLVERLKSLTGSASKASSLNIAHHPTAIYLDKRAKQALRDLRNENSRGIKK